MSLFQVAATAIDTATKGLAGTADTAKKALAQVVDTAKTPVPTALDTLAEADVGEAWWTQPHWVGLAGVILTAAVSLLVYWLTKRAADRRLERTLQAERALRDEEWQRRAVYDASQQQTEDERKRTQRQADQEAEAQQQREREETDESRYLRWLSHRCEFLPFTGLPRRSDADGEPELEHVYVSLKAVEKVRGEPRGDDPAREAPLLTIAEALQRLDSVKTKTS